MNPQKVHKLKTLLEEVEAKFVLSREIESDAIAPALAYADAQDKEFAAFVCAVLAYGKVEHIKSSVRKLLDPFGDRPVTRLLSMKTQNIKAAVGGWKHRFNTEHDGYNLLLVLRSIYSEEGSIEAFMCTDCEITNIRDLLEGFVTRVEERVRRLKLKPSKSFWFFFSKPSSGSACKRLNLYLRWMVGDGPFDLNLWKSLPKSWLMIPLDVHLLNQARSLKLTQRKQADWKTVEEVTNRLKLLDEGNPTRFDFALCHLGINGKILASLVMFFALGCQTPAPKSESAAVKLSPSAAKVKFTQQDEVRFFRAIREDDVEQVRFFISMGMDLNKNFQFEGLQPETPLGTAIESRSRKVLRVLLDSGALPDQMTDPSQTELISAILSRQEALAMELIDKGADVNKALAETGETALMSAARVGLCGVVKRLIDKGARTDQQNEDGYTALMYSAEYARAECVEHLLAAKAKTSIQNAAGRTARALAADSLPENVKTRLD